MVIHCGPGLASGWVRGWTPGWIPGWVPGGGGGAVDGGAAQQAAREELTRHEYHQDDPGLLSRVLSWIGRKISSLISSGSSSHLLLIVGVVLAAVALLFVARAGVSWPRRGRRRGDGDTDADLLRPVNAAQHRRLAAQLATAGRNAEALREWLRAAVATVEERGVLPPRPGRTGATTAREAGSLLPDAAADLRAATTAFDEVWFGGRPATAADVVAAQAAADAVLRAPLADAVSVADAMSVADAVSMAEGPRRADDHAAAGVRAPQ